MSKQLFSLLLPCILCLLWGTVGRADLIFEFQDVTMTPGSLGRIDVFIRSSNGLDQLGRFAAKFQITQVSGIGVLEFQSPQNNSERNDSEYVFFNTKGTTGFASIRNTNDRGILTQGDRTVNDTTTSSVGTSRQLLARLELQHISPVEADAVYKISLVNDSSTFFRLADNTTSVSVSNQAFSNVGTVNVTAVPEPSLSAYIFVVQLFFHQVRARRRNGC